MIGQTWKVQHLMKFHLLTAILTLLATKTGLAAQQDPLVAKEIERCRKEIIAKAPQMKKEIEEYEQELAEWEKHPTREYEIDMYIRPSQDNIRQFKRIVSLAKSGAPDNADEFVKICNQAEFNIKNFNERYHYANPLEHPRATTTPKTDQEKEERLSLLRGQLGDGCSPEDEIKTGLNKPVDANEKYECRIQKTNSFPGDKYFRVYAWEKNAPKDARPALWINFGSIEKCQQHLKESYHGKICVDKNAESLERDKHFYAGFASHEECVFAIKNAYNDYICNGHNWGKSLLYKLRKSKDGNYTTDSQVGGKNSKIASHANLLTCTAEIHRLTGKGGCSTHSQDRSTATKNIR